MIRSILYKMPFKQAQLKHLIEVLKSNDVKDDYAVIANINHHTTITLGKPHSYRGNYGDVSFEPIKLSDHNDDEEIDAPESAMVKNVLPMLEAVIGATFCGWKGGDWTMDGDTDVFIARSGETGYCITDVIIDKDTKTVELITESEY